MHHRADDNRPAAEPDQSTSAIVYSYDLSGNITFLNHEGERLSGYSREEACRMNVAEILDPEFAGHISKQILRDAQEPVGAVFEIDVIAKDGHRIPLEVSTRVVLREGDRIEVEGIAVPSVIRNQSSFSFGLRCVDKDFCYGNMSGLMD